MPFPFNTSSKYRIGAILFGLGLTFILVSLVSFKQAKSGTAENVVFMLNLKQDTMFKTLEDFQLNDSLIFADANLAKKYKLVNYELRLLARPKALYHTVVRTHALPKDEISRYYKNAENTVTVFFSDIRLESLKDHHIVHAKALKFKIFKAKIK